MNPANHKGQKKKKKILLFKNITHNDTTIHKSSFLFNSNKVIERNNSNNLNSEYTLDSFYSGNNSKIIEPNTTNNKKHKKVINIHNKEIKIITPNKSFSNKKNNRCDTDYISFNSFDLTNENNSFSHKKNIINKNRRSKQNSTKEFIINNTNITVKKYTFNHKKLVDNNLKNEILNKITNRKNNYMHFIKDEYKNISNNPNLTFTINNNNNKKQNNNQHNKINEINKNMSRNILFNNKKKLITKIKKNYDLNKIKYNSNSITPRTIIFNIKEQNKTNNNDMKYYSRKNLLYNNNNLANNDKNKDIIKENNNVKNNLKNKKANTNTGLLNKNKVYINKKNIKDDLENKSNLTLLKKKLEAYKANESKPKLSYSTLFSEQINNVNENESKYNINNTYSNNYSVEKITKKLKLSASINKKGVNSPGEPEKINQDNLFKVKFENLNLSFYGICDGHGKDGHLISKYISTNLPYILYEELKKNNIYNSINSYISIIFENIFLLLNSLLINKKEIDSAFSGSTCVSLLLCNDQIISCNLGDSRAIKGQFINKKWKYELLSRDHNPNEPDEMKRIKENKGIIKPYIDENGEPNGPDRIWLPNQAYPGIAMSRSFGDQVAAQIGVISIPEILFFPYIEDDKFIVIGSDGLWEYVSNQEVVDIVGKYYFKNDCDKAIKELYETAFEKWRENNICVDDISIILIFLE